MWEHHEFSTATKRIQAPSAVPASSARPVIWPFLACLRTACLGGQRANSAKSIREASPTSPRLSQRHLHALKSQYQFTLDRSQFPPYSDGIEVADMKKILWRTACLTLALPVWSQQLDLGQYLQRLRTAPGLTISEKIDNLTRAGVTLSPRGWTELQRAARPVTGPELSLPPFTPASTSMFPAWPSTVGPSPRPSTWRAPDSTLALYDYGNGITGTSRKLGPFQFHNFSNGVSGTTQRLDSFEFHNFSNGLSGTSQRIGSLGFTYWNDGLMTNSHQIGPFRHYYSSDGTSGFSHSIGSFTWSSDSTGRQCTTQRIGSLAVTNCW